MSQSALDVTTVPQWRSQDFSEGGAQFKWPACWPQGVGAGGGCAPPAEGGSFCFFNNVTGVSYSFQSVQLSEI